MAGTVGDDIYICQQTASLSSNLNSLFWIIDRFEVGLADLFPLSVFLLRMALTLRVQVCVLFYNAKSGLCAKFHLDLHSLGAK